MSLPADQANHKASGLRTIPLQRFSRKKGGENETVVYGTMLKTSNGYFQILAEKHTHLEDNAISPQDTSVATTLSILVYSIGPTKIKPKNI